MTPQDQAQTIRFFEGFGKPLSTREVEILAEEEAEEKRTRLKRLLYLLNTSVRLRRG